MKPTVEHQGLAQQSPPDLKQGQGGQAVSVTSPAVSPQKVSGSGFVVVIASLRASCLGYAPLMGLASLRKVLVFPQAPERADIMFVGEAPGYHDEKAGIPFAGPAGEKLNGILKAMNLSRETVHVTNIVKFRPAIANQTTNNRPATAEELSASKPLIDQEIATLKPKVIVSLGTYAARFFTGEEKDIDEIRAGSYSYNGIPLVPTYHPSFLLHTQQTKDKRTLWEDMLKVMEMLQMPISDRQKGFFKPKG